jgi:hypothetical protein
MSDNLPVPVEPSPLVLIQQALAAKIPASELKELFDLQVRHEQRRAEEAYADAITAFQSECPPIRKNKQNQGQSYADFEGIMRTINPLLRRHRIVITFDTDDQGEKMLTTCRVRVGVVEKLTTISLPVVAVSQRMNATQAGGSVMSYGRRYAIVAALNLVMTDEDDDGQGDSDPLVTQAEIDELDAVIAESEEKRRVKVNYDRLLAAFGGPECRVASQLRRSQWALAIKDQRDKIAAAKGGV